MMQGCRPQGWLHPLENSYGMICWTHIRDMDGKEAGEKMLRNYNIYDWTHIRNSNPWKILGYWSNQNEPAAITAIIKVINSC